MFCPERNSYLQLYCAVNPRVINNAVDHALQRIHFNHTEPPPPLQTTIPAIQRMTSMQPSLYAPHVDITRARRGFERIGLRVLIRQLHDRDQLVQLQAIHSIMDQVQITESATYLIDKHVCLRLFDLLCLRNPVAREKVCITLTHLATYHEGRLQMLRYKHIFHDLMWLWLKDRKEIRYAAAYTLRTLSKDRCTCQEIVKTPDIIENLLKMAVNDHVGIVLIHLKTLENLIEWDPVVPLKANAFQTMLSLFTQEDDRIKTGSMNCLTQLLKHEIGSQLADKFDLTMKLLQLLKADNIEVIISAVELMRMSTLTTQSKWRAKEFCNRLTKRLVRLCSGHNKPLLQLACMQVLINLCDCPDIRYHVKAHWEETIKDIKLRTHEDWDGTSETTTYGLETGHFYRTMAIEPMETIKNEYGDNCKAINVHSYLIALREMKDRLIEAINHKPYP
ncbi:hypothetical protein JYU34_010790 [Plutella xylostella]|uniref:Uncharacterized protein n=1 Tax=Plutella xylostella TaxID=51655 RepID=A0ABQ7QGH3_PLUXY|nr:hypothetical protein JYU34_010790 [Plutella xylostella]